MKHGKQSRFCVSRSEERSRGVVGKSQGTVMLGIVTQQQCSRDFKNCNK